MPHTEQAWEQAAVAADAAAARATDAAERAVGDGPDARAARKSAHTAQTLAACAWAALADPERRIGHPDTTRRAACTAAGRADDRAAASRGAEPDWPAGVSARAWRISRR